MAKKSKPNKKQRKKLREARLREESKGPAQPPPTEEEKKEREAEKREKKRIKRQQRRHKQAAERKRLREEGLRESEGSINPLPTSERGVTDLRRVTWWNKGLPAGNRGFTVAWGENQLAIS